MKKIITSAAVISAASIMSVSAFADNVYVTISDDSGKLVAAQEEIELTDVDGDGALTVNDALYNAHEKLYDGGATAGYGSDTGDYGLFITKLWGVENGGSYGYYVNTASAMGLTDPVKDGDSVSAFVYTDTTAFSDTFCYFEESVQEDCVLFIDAEAGKEITYTLVAATFDENWAPITVPVAGAEITIDGKKTGVKTDENGKATITVPAVGNHIISAVSDSQTLVPPVAKLTSVDNINANTVEVSDAPATGDVAAATDSSKGSPDTGIEDVAVIAGLALLAGGAIAVTRRK